VTGIVNDQQMSATRSIIFTHKLGNGFVKLQLRRRVPVVKLDDLDLVAAISSEYISQRSDLDLVVRSMLTTGELTSA